MKIVFGLTNLDIGGSVIARMLEQMVAQIHFTLVDVILIVQLPGQENVIIIETYWSEGNFQTGTSAASGSYFWADFEKCYQNP